MTGGLLIDANLLCLLVVGATSRSEIAHHKRARSYDPKDYDLVAEAIERFSAVVVCPHVLTETSNLLRHTNETFALQLQAVFAELIHGSSSGQSRPSA